MRRPYLLVVLLAIVCPIIASCAERGAVLGKAIKPRSLSVSIGGFTGPSYSVEWDGEKLTYSYNKNAAIGAPGTQTEIVIPSDSDWQAFKAGIERSRPWMWREEYVDHRKSDGTFWRMELDFDEQTIKSEGVNDFPNSKQFEHFLNAVSALVGDREFR